MPMCFNILREWHVMVGCDFHDEMMLAPPFKAPLVPHAAGHVLQGGGPLQVLPSTVQKTTDKTIALYTKIMQRNTDIGSGIPHFPLFPPAFLLLVVIIPFSGSKSYWGASSVLVENKPIAAAILGPVNINLNCGDPTAQPFNVVFAPGNVVCGLTFGDFIGGLVAMAVDMAITGLFYLLGQGIGKRVGDGFLDAVVGSLINQIVQQLTGSPIGYTLAPGQSVSDWGSIGNLGQNIGGLVGRAIDGPGPAPDIPTGTHLGFTPAGLATPARLSPGTPLPAGSILNDPGVEEF